uniref:Uncharacterized protein n=1 Tax=Opuntia streptacantha TaxID=393608 RepID=A0A7C9EE02_OPUST
MGSMSGFVYMESTTVNGMLASITKLPQAFAIFFCAFLNQLVAILDCLVLVRSFSSSTSTALSLSARDDICSYVVFLNPLELFSGTVADRRIWETFNAPPPLLPPSS